MTKYPEKNLSGLIFLTDETGIIQHSKYAIIDRKHGYTTDDNARALIVVLRHYHIFKENEALNLARTYLMFLLHMHKEDGKFHNLLGFNREYLDDEGSEDSMGRAIWSLGCTLNSKTTEEMKKLAKWLFDESLPVARNFTSPRARSFTLLGLSEYWSTYSEDANILKDIEYFADTLVKQYNVESSKNWKWYETYLTYANARIPHSILGAYEITGNQEYLEISLDSLDFLIENEFKGSIYHPVGSNGWYFKNSIKAEYDQQPIEASCMVEATLKAWKVSTKKDYLKRALEAFRWYHKNNIANADLVELSTFTCYDGLTTKGVNQNQGAESTISYYLAYLELLKNNLLM
jgi:hypothetical protein